MKLTLMEQMNRWVDGESVCPAGEYNECCPDFSCCQGPELLLPRAEREEHRRQYVAKRVKWAIIRARDNEYQH